jgi:hypothetical protein
VPRWQYVYLDDRIRVFEGGRQWFGTQWRNSPTGPVPYPLEDPDGVDRRRAEVGLPSMGAWLAAAEPEPPFDEAAARRREELELAWRKRVGWIR